MQLNNGVGKAECSFHNTHRAAGLTCGRKLRVLLGGRLYALRQHQLLSKIFPIIVDLAVFSRGLQSEHM